VSISNPLDLTPMAGEHVFLKTVELLSLEKDIIVLSIVPFTEKLNSLDHQSTSEFVATLVSIRKKSGKTIIIVVDAGELYENYRQIFRKQNFPVFCSIEKPMIILKKLCK
jgi:acyl-CoA synthetase (NDP forming)